MLNVLVRILYKHITWKDLDTKPASLTTAVVVLNENTVQIQRSMGIRQDKHGRIGETCQSSIFLCRSCVVVVLY